MSEEATTHPRRKTMTPAALEANRRNSLSAGTGRPPGINGTGLAFKERCQRHDEDFIAQLENIALSDPNIGFRMTAIRDLWDRGHGRPSQTIEGSGPGGAIAFQVLLPTALIDDET